MILKSSVITMLAMIYGHLALGQLDESVKILSNQEVDSVFTQSVKSELNLDYEIFRVYEYFDQAGKHFLVLTENRLLEVDAREQQMPMNDKISGVMVTEFQGRFRVDRRMFDFTLPEGNEVDDEDSIFFMTKYVSLSDVDGDGLIDPILVYGTGTRGWNNGTGTSRGWNIDNGRIRILVYHLGVKRAIRHQNGTLDWERITRVGDGFCKLPAPIIERARTIMGQMEENDHAIFTAYPGICSADQARGTFLSQIPADSTCNVGDLPLLESVHHFRKSEFGAGFKMLIYSNWAGPGAEPSKKVVFTFSDNQEWYSVKGCFSLGDYWSVDEDSIKRLEAGVYEFKGKPDDGTLSYSSSYRNVVDTRAVWSAWRSLLEQGYDWEIYVIGGQIDASLTLEVLEID